MLPTEVTDIQVLVIVDNELDPISPYPATLEAFGNLAHVGRASSHMPTDRGENVRELRMEDICCGAHGLSLMITAKKGEEECTLLFDTGPEGEVWERNTLRLRADIAKIDVIMLSHWHRDHSGGMVRAVQLITEARKVAGKTAPVVVDLQPDRPAFRGFQTPDGIFSLQADPSFEELEAAGAQVRTNKEMHGVLGDCFVVSGEIARTTTYELGVRRGMRYLSEGQRWIKDTLLLDERSLMMNLKDRGLVVFTGCGHAGVVNTVRHAIAATGKVVPVHAVFGGFHLADADEETVRQSVEDLLEFDPKIMMPGHCTGWRAKFEMEKRMPGRLAPSTVGTRFSFL